MYKGKFASVGPYFSSMKITVRGVSAAVMLVQVKAGLLGIIKR